MGFDPKQVPLRWVFPPEARSVYATNMAVQATPEEVILSFFEKIPPIAATPAEALRILDAQGGMEARLVARVTMDHKRAGELLATLGGVFAAKPKPEGDPQ